VRIYFVTVRALPPRAFRGDAWREHVGVLLAKAKRSK
jgi:hypothetical protein